jgi:hypothetical protein
MATERARREGEEEREPAAPRPPEPEPLDSGTVQALRNADPRSRAQTLTRLQRLHGNAAVARVVRALQVTEAGHAATAQATGERAHEAAPTGALDKALLYREVVEAELDRAGAATRSERELVQDNVGTIGQIFANYQAALHLFEGAVQEGGVAEHVPRALAREVLQEAAREVLEPVVAAVEEAVPELGRLTGEGVAPLEDVREEATREPGTSAPAHAIRTLVIAERRRLADVHAGTVGAQAALVAAEEARSDGTPERLALLAAADGRLEELKRTSHSPDALLRRFLRRWEEAAKGVAQVEVELDADWRVVRAVIHAPHGAELARELLSEANGRFDLGLLRMGRHVRWAPAELATCEAAMDEGGRIRRAWSNERGAGHLDGFEQRLRAGGLPPTSVLSGG